ncbi:uncharacterized protein PFL1_01707 [Pseudozyma flocculosa PF-1]|uniref:Probable a1-mating type protein Rba1 n=1 Tax=Pseudozyma flocculosa TaxID=84751 RepID=A0A5C3F0N5_9BASI|nr:uncharacterized protein PFL1_01707 [Pseudozyma flocculosa PF-1]EPQ30806.1 hypothetical protein PFL1_01707 [Pseudozyma flocculosa PF-1]SPO36831.1 probable a1-mating type protein Rba1 [Pseudozyma flocculosa]
MSSYRKVDPSDPRRADLTRPLQLPAAWRENDLDMYGSFLGGASMMSGAAMLTRAPQIAYLGMIFAVAHLAHDKPFKSEKNKESPSGGPLMSLLFSAMAMLALMVPKMAVSDPLNVAKAAAGSA